MPASRNVRRELVWATEALGFQLAYTDELVREIVDTKKDWKTARRVAEAVGELTSDVMVESNHAANARELCDALRRDHPDWAGSMDVNRAALHAKWTRDALWRTVRGAVSGRTIPQHETEVIARDHSHHDRNRHGGFLRDIGHHTQLDANEVLAALRTEIAARRDGTWSPDPPAQRDKVETPLGLRRDQIEARFRIDLMFEVVEALDIARRETQGDLVENDVRRMYVHRLSCDARDFASWALKELRDDDLPTRRIAVAVALGQTLDGYRASNVGDREHAAVMSRSGLFVTADRKLAAVLGHQKLPRWIPQRWMLLEKQSTDGFRELVRQLSKATRQSN
ncbi:MAG: hypothetical protein H6697_11555 [Myxococcales bacterium]|nr:hypothetical protein [Myxococcales bacterium]